MTQLVAHIKSLNAKSKAWMDAEPGRWAGMLVEDAAHWAEYGVYTVEDFERYQLETTIYEGFKDAYGVKGRHYDFASMSMDELRAEADRISQAAHEAFEREQEDARLAVEEFEAEVARTIGYGASDRATALRWMTQDETFYHSQDVEHWVWDRGMLFTDEGKALVKELMDIVKFKEIA